MKYFTQQIIISIIILLTCACNTSPEKENDSHAGNPISYVGHIPFDKSQDDPNFQPCNEDLALVYYNFGDPFLIKGEKPTITEVFADINFSSNPLQSGYITIRFMVNCKGETGRFRMEQMDNNYNDSTFPKNLTNQLMVRTKSIQDWLPAELQGRTYDNYRYITFKFIDNHIIDILP